MHFERGRELGRAVEYLIHAGDNATRRYAYPEAKAHFSRALDLVEKLPKEEQTQRLMTLHQKRGVVSQAMGRFDEAINDFNQMLQWARVGDDPEAECLALNSTLCALYWAQRLDEMDAVAEEALHAAEKAGNLGMRAETLAFKPSKPFPSGNLTEAMSLVDEATRLARAANYKPAPQFALQGRGAAHYYCSEYEAAEIVLVEAFDLALKLRDGFQMLLALFYLGMVRGNPGRMSEALAAFHQHVQMGERNGNRFWLIRVPNCVGWIYRELQDFDGALMYDEESRAMAHEVGMLEAEANALINLAHSYTHMGEPEKAASACREVEDICERDDRLRWRYDIRLQAAKCENAVVEGDPERAKQIGLHLLEKATQYQAHKYIALAHNMLAEIAMAGGDLAEAETEFAAALEELRAYPAPLVAWKTYALLGRLRLQQSDSASARETYTQAADIVRMMASNVTDENLRATFLASPAVEEVLAGEKRVDS